MITHQSHELCFCKDVARLNWITQNESIHTQKGGGAIFNERNFCCQNTTSIFVGQFFIFKAFPKNRICVSIEELWVYIFSPFVHKYLHTTAAIFVCLFVWYYAEGKWCTHKVCMDLLPPLFGFFQPIFLAKEFQTAVQVKLLIRNEVFRFNNFCLLIPHDCDLFAQQTNKKMVEGGRQMYTQRTRRRKTKSLSRSLSSGKPIASAILYCYYYFNAFYASPWKHVAQVRVGF